MSTSVSVVMQTPGLVFRRIDDLYYVTNPHKRQIVVLNVSAFRILELVNKRSVEDLCRILCSDGGVSGADSEALPFSFDNDDILKCLRSLNEASLISFE